jgi:hypothetical protein
MTAMTTAQKIGSTRVVATMTKHHIRGYAVALSLLGFSSVYGVIAKAPFPHTSAATAQAQVAAAPAVDPRIAALDARAAQLRQRAAKVRKALSSHRAAAQAAAIAAATPAPVRYVSRAPVTQTKTS